MATSDNNYDQMLTQNNYSESDLNGGGEQIPSAIYLNEQLAQQQTQITNKQNTIIRGNGPDFPPNPELNDMYIDYSATPNIIYQWDGTQWNKATATDASEVGAYTIAQVDDANNNLQVAVDAVSSRTDVVEETLADGEGLAATITGTTTYKTDRDGAVQDGINTWVGTMQDESTAQNTLPTFVTQGQLTEKANDITAKFSAVGGVNLLKNSVGWGGLTHWQTESGSASQYIGDDCIEAGSGLTMTDGTISQAVACVAGNSYTLTAKVKKGTAGTAYMQLGDGQTFQEVDMIDTAAYNYTTIQVANFIPQTNSLVIKFSGTGVTGGVIFTAAMLNTGDEGLQWSLANGEIYNTSTQMDINGLTVQSSVYDGYTVMSPSEFSGYYRNDQGVMQKVFTLNKDTTEVAKLAVTDADAEISMGSVKALYIQGGGYDGWAFIPSS